MNEKMNLEMLDNEPSQIFHKNLQKTHDGHLAVSVELQRVVISQLGGQVDHRERGGILQGVCQVLGPPIGCASARLCPPSSHVFCQTLAQSNRAWESHNDRHYQVGTASTVRLGGGGQSVSEEHAKTDVEVSQHPRITCQRICQQNITKFAILRLCQTTNSDSLQGQEKPNSPSPRRTVKRPDENEKEDDEDRLRDEVEAFHKLC